MKKFLTLIMLTLPVVTFAQSGPGSGLKGKTEVYAGYGLLTAQDVITGLSDVFTAVLLPGRVKRIDTKGFGAAFGGVDYYVGNRFALGLQFNHASYKRRYEMSDQSTETLTTRYQTLMLRGKAIWASNSSFQLYSALAVGPSFIHSENDKGETRNETAPAFQASALGIRVGNQVAFFMEAGFGFQGLLSGGISARF